MMLGFTVTIVGIPYGFPPLILKKKKNPDHGVFCCTILNYTIENFSNTFHNISVIVIQYSHHNLVHL